MSNQPMSGVAPAALLFALVAGPAEAQYELSITSKPSPTETVAGVTVLTFSATVPQDSPGGMVYWVQRGSCTKTGLLGTGAWKCSDDYWITGVGSGSVTLSFPKTFQVPAGTPAGDKLCFKLVRAHVSTLGTSIPGLAEGLDEECRTVTTPTVTRATTANEPVASQPVGLPTSTPTVRAADQPPTTVARAPLPPPDLTLAYEKAPEARWVVRNSGQGPAPATVLRLSRAGLPDKNIAIPALAVGATFAVVVTPDLDAYLVNAKGMVDPDGQVGESNESNNGWQSVQSR